MEFVQKLISKNKAEKALKDGCLNLSDLRDVVKDGDTPTPTSPDEVAGNKDKYDRDKKKNKNKYGNDVVIRLEQRVWNNLAAGDESRELTDQLREALDIKPEYERIGGSEHVPEGYEDAGVVEDERGVSWKQITLITKPTRVNC